MYTREHNVQATHIHRLKVTVPASNATHVTLKTLIAAAQTALVAAGSTDYIATMDISYIMGVKISKYAPGANSTTLPTGLARAAIVVADGLNSPGVIDMSRAEYVAAGEDYVNPATRDWISEYPVSVTTSGVPVVLILATVIGG